MKKINRFLKITEEIIQFCIFYFGILFIGILLIFTERILEGILITYGMFGLLLVLLNKEGDKHEKNKK